MSNKEELTVEGLLNMIGVLNDKIERLENEYGKLEEYDDEFPANEWENRKLGKQFRGFHIDANGVWVEDQPDEGWEYLEGRQWRLGRRST